MKCYEVIIKEFHNQKVARVVQGAKVMLASSPGLVSSFVSMLCLEGVYRVKVTFLPKLRKSSGYSKDVQAEGGQ